MNEEVQRAPRKQSQEIFVKSQLQHQTKKNTPDIMACPDCLKNSSSIMFCTNLHSRILVSSSTFQRHCVFFPWPNNPSFATATPGPQNQTQGGRLCSQKACQGMQDIQDEGVKCPTTADVNGLRLMELPHICTWNIMKLSFPNSPTTIFAQSTSHYPSSKIYEQCFNTQHETQNEHSTPNNSQAQLLCQCMS